MLMAKDYIAPRRNSQDIRDPVSLSVADDAQPLEVTAVVVAELGAEYLVMDVGAGTELTALARLTEML